jgi:hypothetical protein
MGEDEREERRAKDLLGVKGRVNMGGKQTALAYISSRLIRIHAATSSCKLLISRVFRTPRDSVV